MDNGLNEDLVFRYMCGELSEDDRNRLEKDYFASDEVFDAVRAIEDDWIDQFVRGELADDRRARFERGFLPSADARHRIAVARSLARATATVRLPGSSPAAARRAHLAAPRWLPYAALVAAAAGGVGSTGAHGLRPRPPRGCRLLPFPPPASPRIRPCPARRRP